MSTYGYVRVSTKEQHDDRQIHAMMEVGIERENIFCDQQSGGNFARAGYKTLLKHLKTGDVLYIKSIDRLGRNYKEIQKQWRILTKDLGVDIVVLDMPLLDTRQGKDLMGTFLSDVVLQILSFVAENERENIRQRQAEGIAIAKAKGVKFGRKAQPYPENFEFLVEQTEAGKMTLVTAARLCGLPESTFRYKKKAYLESKEKVD